MPALAEDPLGGSAANDKQQQAELFDRLDANHDGTITSDEATEENQRLFQRLVRRADKDGDHKISREEFMAAPEGPGRSDGPGEPRERRGPRGPGEGRPDDRRGPPGGPMAASAVMRALDADGDGTISASELNNAATTLKILDKNGDGQVTREELMPPGFASFGGGRGGPDGPRPEFDPEAMAKRIISERDKNGDGKLQKEELAERMQERFDRMDTNQDGAIDEAELKQGFERRGRAGGEGPNRPGRPGGREGRPGGPEGPGPDGAGPKGAKTEPPPSP